MYTLIALVFVVGYLAIALEHPIHINKAASALLTGMLIWTVIMLGYTGLFTGEETSQAVLGHELMEHLGDIASILFFLLGAMTVVELMDAHEGFEVITDRIQSTNKVTLLWMLGILTFFLSAALDNMTTAIVMCALLRKIIKDKETCGPSPEWSIISANAGGAWSPIGDVTTIMLWIGGQVTSANIIAKLILPSLVCLMLPLLWLSFTTKGTLERPDLKVKDDTEGT